jgi:hypothetical protein
VVETLVLQHVTWSSALQLEGRLSQFPLRELIEMVVYSSVKGLLELRASGELALLYFDDGVPCHARAGGYIGVEAVGLMFELPDADFRFYAGSTPDSENVWMDPLELIENAEHLAHSWQPPRQHIPSFELVPMLVQNAAVDSVQISDTTWPVLSAVDGQRSVADIAEHVRYTLLDVCAALVEFKHKGLITFESQRRASSAQAGMVGGASQGDERSGFFEKLIARTLEQEAKNPDSRYAPPQNRYQPSSDGSQAPGERYRSAEGRYVDAEG